MVALCHGESTKPTPVRPASLTNTMNTVHIQDAATHIKWALAQGIKKLPDVITEKQEARFHRKVDRSGGPDACWPWLGWHQGGYGTVKINKVAYRAHRVAFRLGNKTQPTDLCVCHRCDNPICCNPAHLFVGMITENISDMVRKNRHGHGASHSSVTRIECRPRGADHYWVRHPEVVKRGEDHAMHVLTEEQVTEIRRLYAAGVSRKQLRLMFSVSKGNIAFIVTRGTWKHLP